MKNKTIIFSVIIVVALIFLTGIFSRNESSSDDLSASSDLQQAPDFTLEKLGGGNLVLSEYRGVKPVILDFWATWCPNCQRDMPKLSGYYEKYKDQVEVIGVNLQENESLVKKFVENRNITFPIVFDPQSKVARSFAVRYTNYHVLIDIDGNILKTIPGDIKESDILELIESEAKPKEQSVAEISSNEESAISQVKKEFNFKLDGLNTNTAKKSISLSDVLSGGPGKDGIPALNNPKFVSIKDSGRSVKDDVDGMVVSAQGTVKFYPYSIMVWHEIVNDIVGSKPLVVTFCPLCGSAIVFDAEVAGKVENFGVSGKLYESNLLMYDNSTESLWSQSIGEAVVGDRTGEKLSVYPSQVMSYKDFKSKWPSGLVLSTDTGHRRNYSVYPYGDYDSSDDIFFPVSVKDNRFSAKEIMYVVNINNHSVAFPLKDLSEKPILINVLGENITGIILDGEIVVKDSSGKIFPGYHEMWFSWATHHQDDGIVGKK